MREGAKSDREPDRPACDDRSLGRVRCSGSEGGGWGEWGGGMVGGGGDGLRWIWGRSGGRGRGEGG